MTKTIVFVHGFMNTGQIWKDWLTFFEAQGYNCHAPSWPYTEGDIPDLRQHPQAERGETTFADVVAHYQTYIKQLPEKPIVIGHSLGGVVVQKLVEKDLAMGAICINSGPPKGILAWNKDFLLSNLQLTNPLSRDKLVLMSARWYHRYVTNDLTFEETQAFIEQNGVPASRRVAATIESIDFQKKHAPLLFIAGEADRSQPPIINQKNAQAYTDPDSRVDFRLFKDRTHNILGQTGWEEVASYCLDWLQEGGL